MKAPDFSYHRPSTIDEAVSLLARLENARCLGGGQSLMPMLNLRIASPDHLIDLCGIAELSGIVQGEGELLIGAMTSQRALERSELVAKAAPLLFEAVGLVGHQQTRNRGTIGGSLCHLDPGAELPVAAAALDARLVVIGPGGSREIAFSEFPAGYLTTCLASDEILTTVRIPKVLPGTGCAFVEFNRRPADFAIVSVAAILRVDADQRISQAAIALGGSFEAPVRLRAIESDLIGQRPEGGLFTKLAAMARTVPCDGDSLYPADYRQDLAATLVERALVRAAVRVGIPADV